MKDKGIIDRAMVSFSISSMDQEDPPYALFGGVNSTQIVNGTDGLVAFPSYPNFLGTWALEGQKVHYGGKPLDGTDGPYPSIIDTGTSQLSIPPKVFESLHAEWQQAIPGGLDCKTDETFCLTQKKCDEITPFIKPVGIQMSGQIFEL